MRRVFLIQLMSLTVLSGAIAPPATAAIPFEIRDVSDLGWQWPAAVAIGFGDPIVQHGVLHYDVTDHQVKYTYTYGYPGVTSENVALGTDPVKISATTDRYDFWIHACFYLHDGSGSALRYATKQLSGSWSVEPIATGTDLGNWYNDIAYREDLGPLVVYVDNVSVAGRSRLVMAHRTLGFWSSNIVLDDAIASRPVQSPGIAAATDVATHIAWFRDGTVKYAFADDLVPAAAETVVTAQDLHMVAIALDRQGTPAPHIAYAAGGSLWIADRTVSGWQSTEVLPAAYDVRNIDFVYGYDRNPYVFFTTSDDLRPLQCATPFRGVWHVQDVGTGPAFPWYQAPSVFASHGIVPEPHLLVAWSSIGVDMAWDNTGGIAFAESHLRGCPGGDLASTVRLWTTMRYPITGGKVQLDIGEVWTQLDFCAGYALPPVAWIGTDTTATFNLPVGGAVAEGIGIQYLSNPPVVVEPSVPLANVDQDQDLAVTPADHALFETRVGTGDPRSDFDGDGDVDADDRAILLHHMFHSCGVTSGVGTDGTPPVALSLSAQPNPFNPRTSLSFTLAAAGRTRLRVFSPDGRLVVTLLEGDLPSGPHAVTWDGCDGHGQAAASGTYLARLETGSEVRTAHLVLLR